MAMQLSAGIQQKVVTPSNITTYGAIVLPFNYIEEKPIINQKVLSRTSDFLIMGAMITNI